MPGGTGGTAADAAAAVINAGKTAARPEKREERPQVNPEYKTVWAGNPLPFGFPAHFLIMLFSIFRRKLC